MDHEKSTFQNVPSAELNSAQIWADVAHFVKSWRLKERTNVGISMGKIDLLLSKQKYATVQEKSRSFPTNQKLLESDQYSQRYSNLKFQDLSGFFN